MKRLLVGLLLLALIVTSFACARAPTPGPTLPPESKPGTVTVAPPAPTIIIPRPTPSPTPIPVPAPSPAPVFSDGGQAGGGDVVDRMIVRTGSMALVVNDVAKTIDEIANMANSLKGYVVASRSWREGERLMGQITIRVPAATFDESIRRLRALAVEVASETTSSKDVTEEYVDLQARLGNLQATEAQLLKILEKAIDVQDILEVQRELSNVRGQIEQTKGRIQFLERTSETSLIDISLVQAKLDAKFTANKARVKAGEQMQFFSQVAGGFTPYSFEWSFGDGQTSTDSNPTHVYKSRGAYTVTLKVTDDKGNTDTETRKDYVTVVPGWSAGIVASSAWNGLVSFGRGLANFLIWIGIFSPVWLIVGGGAYWGWRRLHRKKA